MFNCMRCGQKNTSARASFSTARVGRHVAMVGARRCRPPVLCHRDCSLATEHVVTGQYTYFISPFPQSFMCAIVIYECVLDFAHWPSCAAIGHLCSVAATARGRPRPSFQVNSHIFFRRPRAITYVRDRHFRLRRVAMGPHLSSCSRKRQSAQ